VSVGGSTDRSSRRGEARHAAANTRGGYLAASGRLSARLTGVESATMGFDHSYPYVLSANASRARR